MTSFKTYQKNEDELQGALKDDLKKNSSLQGSLNLLSWDAEGMKVRVSELLTLKRNILGSQRGSQAKPLGRHPGGQAGWGRCSWGRQLGRWELRIHQKTGTTQHMSQKAVLNTMMHVVALNAQRLLKVLKNKEMKYALN